MASTMDTKVKEQKQKVLLMGKSGSGKSSMRNIIFSNYVAKDVRRLGATIDVEHSRVKFLGNLVLNLWDCGGQDAFTETYLTTQRKYMFSDVGVLIHVWDIESRGSDEDEYGTYRRIIGALEEYSPHCHVFGLVHKIDLVQQGPREEVIAKKTDTIRSNSGSFADSLICYPTTIWDQSLYRAWGSIVNRLIPNLSIIEDYLNHLAHAIDAEEVVLFERTTFLTVMSVTTAVGQQNPCYDRHERLSNIIKTFKHSLANFTSSSTSSHQFNEFFIKTPRFNLIIAKLTHNTFVLAVLPPGEAELNCTRINIATARDAFVGFDTPIRGNRSEVSSMRNTPHGSYGR